MMIAIRHSGTGEVQFVASLAGYGAGWAQLGGALPAGVPLDLLTLSGNTWIEDPAKVRAQLLAAVKAEAEGRKMTFLSNGGAKKAEYAQKAAEVAFFDSLGATVTLALAALNAMPAAVKQAKFGFALADAGAFGDTVPAAIERFRVGMTASNKVPTIAATEAKACAALKAATTVAAMRAVVTGITWPA
ncbi:hypothetical protein COA17_07230 [Sphingomonas ginsenosidimutans]|jgi:hypothetical protein|uniref:Uncharacterized protein n=1 Tax=Sphingomonas ginsenosidimutans TaxID=862134 RepID=A0A2A4HZ67_9SPHN|nr:hypothetical protein [Sphingomonas ginsenosidimutans]PCG09644.1 hypothetical protein COA17_07230 [Sphingomonas ginsenosidimutans]